jgi:hypothetical protein
MPAWPDPLQALFARVRSRLRGLAIANAASLALVLSAPLLVARLAGVLSLTACVGGGVVAVVVALAIAVWRSPQRPDLVAAAIESRTPVAKNLFVTAAELVMRPSSIRADVRDVVFRDAADVAGRVDVVALFPSRRAVVTLLMTAVLWTVLALVDPTWLVRARDIVRGGAPGAPAIARVRVTVVPPSYAGKPAQTVTDPERIDALSGSVIRVEVDATADHIDLVGVGERHALARRDGAFSGEVTATADGFIAVQPYGTGDAAGVRRVMSLAVTEDHPPIARIVTPGKDLFLSSAAVSLPVKIEASDDIGLASLRLTYTKVTGSGENFEFKNGEFPLQITREQPQRWTATSSIPLSSMGLEPGDVLVYRAMVGDTRPGNAAIDSDAFVIEILRPGEALAEGFSIDEEKDKYALSQQMIIIKTERLITKKATLAADAFADEAQTIAAEQRKVRAEFVFMMGGEFEDATVAGGDINEEEEAANESELLAGRMQNNGRRDIILATRHMSDAAQLLTNLNPAQALPREKAALDALQRAFTKSRYILRVLTPRERIDDTRRLGGKLGDALSWRRQVEAASSDPRTAALLGALARVADVAALKDYGPAQANALAGIAESILRVDATLSAVAQQFAQAGAAIAAGKSPSDVAALIDAAAVKLSGSVRVGLSPAPSTTDPSQARLQGAMADAMKRRGGRP